MSFDSLGLAPEILSAVRECGYTTPTPIQVDAIPHVLAGRDVMGCAQTGTGKTAAFGLPILHQLRDEEPGRLRALVLVPTRELAIQVGRSIREYARDLPLRVSAVYGGVPFPPQEMMLRYGVDVLVATPGRLKDFMWRGMIDFAHTRFLVLDEADRMLDMGFIDVVREIVREIPRERQSMLFSATLEDEIQRLARDILRNPVRVEVAPPATLAEGIEHRLVRVGSGEKRGALEELLHQRATDRVLVFARTRRGAHQLALHLVRRGHRASSIHSDKSQAQRIEALEGFREGRIRVLVATDIAARGLDVEGISHVINFDLPHSAEDYVHRIGRTARAGHKGMAFSLVGPEDRLNLRSIERLIGTSVAAEDASRQVQPAKEATSRSSPVPAGGTRASARRRRRRSASGLAGEGNRRETAVADRGMGALQLRRGNGRTPAGDAASSGRPGGMERGSTRARGTRGDGPARGGLRRREDRASNSGRGPRGRSESRAEAPAESRPVGFFRRIVRKLQAQH